MKSNSRMPAVAAQICHISLDEDFAPASVATRIAAFLDGRTNGEDVLHELYDHVLDEPIPENMRALLHKG